jgi:hypothetical protein
MIPIIFVERPFFVVGTTYIVFLKFVVVALIGLTVLAPLRSLLLDILRSDSGVAVKKG